jgi:hypothetical protein
VVLNLEPAGGFDMPYLGDEHDAEPQAIALYWDADIESWQLLGIYRNLDEGRESCRRWKSKGTNEIRLYLLDEQFGYETFLGD